MSVTILSDTEEALQREFRNILIAQQRTKTYEAFPSTFDPFTGEKVEHQPLEGHFFDSSANARHIDYPHVFTKILRSAEDLTSGRLVPPYGLEVNTPVPWASRAYNIIMGGNDLTTVSGNTVTTGNLKTILINNTYLLNILSGPNVGYYPILSVSMVGNGPHTIVLNPVLVSNLPANNYRLADGVLTFLSPVDLNTVAAGDTFTDSTSKTYNILGVKLKHNAIILDKSQNANPPSSASGSFIIRTGNILRNPDVNLENFLVLDPSNPVVGKGLLNPTLPNTDTNFARDWAVPLDLTFGITIDTKNFNDHKSVWNRVWEEFNPPRRGLPIIVRSPESSESLLACDIKGTSSNEVEIKSVRTYVVGEYVQIFNGLTTGFNTQIVGINHSTNTLMLADPVPSTFTVRNGTKVVSNVQEVIWEWDFLSHRDNSNDGSHYWSHTYEYRVQVWVNKKYGEEIRKVIKQLEITIEDFQSNVISSIKVP